MKGEFRAWTGSCAVRLMLLGHFFEDSMNSLSLSEVMSSSEWDWTSVGKSSLMRACRLIFLAIDYYYYLSKKK